MVVLLNIQLLVARVVIPWLQMAEIHRTLYGDKLEPI